jgi:hypothetical protein
MLFDCSEAIVGNLCIIVQKIKRNYFLIVLFLTNKIENKINTKNSKIIKVANSGTMK